MDYLTIKPIEMIITKKIELKLTNLHNFLDMMVWRKAPGAS